MHPDAYLYELNAEHCAEGPVAGLVCQDIWFWPNQARDALSRAARAHDLQAWFEGVYIARLELCVAPCLTSPSWLRVSMCGQPLDEWVAALYLEDDSGMELLEQQAIYSLDDLIYLLGIAFAKAQGIGTKRSSQSTSP